MSKNEDREEYDMCLALREWAADERAEGRAEAFNLVMQIISVLRKNKTLSDEAAAAICNCTIAEVESVRKAFEL